MRIYTQQGDTVDDICWRYFSQSSGMIEQVLDANPGLVELGAILPTGTAIELPDNAQQYSTTPILQLWD
ncbi:tail protein X [Proteus myxofaciens]|uniref:Tail component protein n=1 Tax=Proteus myxofaciens ATCC 19692 TaxID=1354337 RepID=A0A198GSD5_9GAMM|nr:tail protein X [Proteus myxofaciens]OAT39146.1 tail component protein [Proteus myxofaciens ATCC 19692]